MPQIPRPVFKRRDSHVAVKSFEGRGRHFAPGDEIDPSLVSLLIRQHWVRIGKIGPVDHPWTLFQIAKFEGKLDELHERAEAKREQLEEEERQAELDRQEEAQLALEAEAEQQAADEQAQRDADDLAAQAAALEADEAEGVEGGEGVDSVSTDATEATDAPDDEFEDDDDSDGGLVLAPDDPEG